MNILWNWRIRILKFLNRRIHFHRTDSAKDSTPYRKLLIHVQSFQNYVQTAYSHWSKAFKKFVHIKSSLHWTLSHVGTLIALNNSYTLAEVSENSIEKFIKPYRYITVNNARSTSIQDNHVDCLRLMYCSRYDIRQFDKRKKPMESDDEISKLIDSFFILNEEGKVWSYKSS